MNTTHVNPPAWYGKLPGLGDFASRRLTTDFVQHWDLWLAESLQAQRDALGDAWQDAYLHSPVWRFVSAPGILPITQLFTDPEALSDTASIALKGPAVPIAQPQSPAFMGVLMPSVDRVGRYFPFTLIQPLNTWPRHALALEHLLADLHHLEDVALDALNDDWGVDELERILQNWAPLSHAIPSTEPRLQTSAKSLARFLHSREASGGDFIPITQVHNRAELSTLLIDVIGQPTPAEPSWPPSLHATSWWLSDNPNDPKLLATRGLPSPRQFIDMLGTRAREVGETTRY
jgi:type VI secretion system protein ImpM